MSVSIKEIAKICGVSEGTVDRALNNRNGIRQETKEKILQVAKEMNYQPNHLARCLATGKTNTIGVVCINMQDTFFSTLVEAIEAAAREKGYFITLILSHNNIEEELAGIKYLANRGVDGLILFPVAGGSEYVSTLKSLNIPIVTIYNRISEDFPHIDVNSYESMKKAVSFIHEKGYDSIAYLDINFDMAKSRGINIYSFERRRAGYAAGVKELGLCEHIINGFGREKIMDYLSVIIDKKSSVNDKKNDASKRAILCSFDDLAIRVLSMCRESGLSVPEDIGLMGFNNQRVLDDIYPRIYSIDCNIDSIGTKAFDKLYGLMKAGDHAQSNVKNVSDNIDSDNVATDNDEVIEYKFSDGQTL